MQLSIAFVFKDFFKEIYLLLKILADGPIKILDLFSSCYAPFLFAFPISCHFDKNAAMIGSMMVVTGQWKKPGVFNVEEFDPDPYMEALNKWGLPWKVCEDPELVKVWKANED